MPRGRASRSFLSARSSRTTSRSTPSSRSSWPRVTAPLRAAGYQVRDLMSTHEPREVDANRGATPLRNGAARITARRAVEAAARAFPQWSATPPGDRGGLLQRASELLMDRQAAIADLVTEETNGTIAWGMFNVQLGAGMLAYYANQADAPAEEQEIPSHIP